MYLMRPHSLLSSSADPDVLAVLAHAALFGSAARGDGGLDSDIDLLIVRPDGVDEEDSAWRAQIDLLYDRVRAWTGNPAAIVDVGADDLPHLIERNPPVLDSIRREGIDLASTRIGRLLRATR